MKTNFQNLEQRFNNLTLKNNASLREKTLARLSNEAKNVFKEIQNLNKKTLIFEEKLEKILNNIENIDDYLASKSKQNSNKVNSNQQEEDNAI